MSEFVPTITYNNYKLPHVQSITDIKPSVKNVVIEGIRGAGCLVITGGTTSFDIQIRGILVSTDTTLPDLSAYAKPTGTEYEKLMEQKNYIETKVVSEATVRTLSIEKADGSYNTYTVQRLQPIDYPASLRNSVQEYILILKVVTP